HPVLCRHHGQVLREGFRVRVQEGQRHRRLSHPQRMSIYDDIEPLGLEGVNTYPLAERPSKVATEDFARPFGEGATLKEFLSSLPNILAVQSIREIAASMRRARESGRPIIWGIGGHVVKVGLAPLIIDLMSRGFVSCVAANGSVLIHDAEIALVGSTSEDV